jgi:hypothetical protein
VVNHLAGFGISQRRSPLQIAGKIVLCPKHTSINGIAEWRLSLIPTLSRDASKALRRHTLAFGVESHTCESMLRYRATLLGLLLPWTAFAQPPASLHATYEAYAAGLHVADVDTGLTTDPRAYQMTLGFNTTGMVGFFFRGQQFSTVTGTWHGSAAAPARYKGQGTWRGTERLTVIDYDHGQPQIRELTPPDPDDREPVPENLQTNAIDFLSAMMQLIHVVAATGRCETAARTFDGRRVTDIEAHTAGPETLEPTSRSAFAGKALRCDFSGRLVAGFKRDEDHDRAARPIHGSAWLAQAVPGGPSLPVRLTFETRYVGNATMNLTDVGPGADVKLAGKN